MRSALQRDVFEDIAAEPKHLEPAVDCDRRRRPGSDGASPYRGPSGRMDSAKHLPGFTLGFGVIPPCPEGAGIWYWSSKNVIMKGDLQILFPRPYRAVFDRGSLPRVNPGLSSLAQTFGTSRVISCHCQAPIFNTTTS